MICALSCVLMVGCKTQMTISGGTSFGHCRGFCNKEITINAHKTTFTKWENGQDNIKHEMMVAGDDKDYRKLVKALDLVGFRKLPERIGCPDCADGGAEWIEVKKGLSKKKVTYEFGNVPEVLKEPARQLKALREKFDDSK